MEISVKSSFITTARGYVLFFIGPVHKPHWPFCLFRLSQFP